MSDNIRVTVRVKMGVHRETKTVQPACATKKVIPSREGKKRGTKGVK